MKDLPQNPTIEQFVGFMIESRMLDIHTSFPAKVVRYDKSKQQADVQPCLKQAFKDGTTIAMPVINNVPVMHPRAGDAIIHLPVAVGSIVTVIIGERSLDRWKSQGGMVDPGDFRKHDLSDAMAYPGGYPFSDPATVTDGTAVEIHYQGSVLAINSNGTITLKGSTINLSDYNPSDFVALASKVLTELNAIVSSHNTHFHTSAAPGNPTTPPVTPMTSPSSVASSKVKAD